jgi:hypothetical protein
MTIVGWIKKAWDSVPAELISKSFRVCGVTNALDNSQDDEIMVLKEGSVLGADVESIKNELLKGANSTGDHVCNSDSELSDNECIFESDSEDDLPLAELV